jgi:hypothetical protein
MRSCPGGRRHAPGAAAEPHDLSEGCVEASVQPLEDGRAQHRVALDAPREAVGGGHPAGKHAPTVHAGAGGTIGPKVPRQGRMM